MYEIDEVKENQLITSKYKEMLRNTYRKLSSEDKVMIRKAFELSLDAHDGQRRKSGEPYIFHPLEVGKIIADEIGLGGTSIAAALLHDVVEDTHYTLEDIEKEFGTKMSSIIDGLTKISIINNQDVSMQSENYRKLLLTLSNDIRVILIKIADRLHNMRTLETVPDYKQRKAASETLFIYAPLAHRLGLYNIKTELENLSLKYTEIETYQHIEGLLEESKEEREKYIEDFIRTLKIHLDQEDISYTIKGRPKSIFSIYKKMSSQNISFDQVFDLFAIRIIYNSSSEKEDKFLAWKIYSIVSNTFRPNPKRLRDWISQPKSTGYESLHTTVMGHKGKWVEVQIRSERMDEVAERGVAAHYKYKEGEENTKDTSMESLIEQVREFLESNESEDSGDFVNNFKLNLYTKEIYAFTPKGDLKSLPKGATTLDFAYAIHTKIGDKCLGARVNGKLMPLSYVLQTGDQVEIITSAQQKPKKSWLDFAFTSRAKSKIKSAINIEKKEKSDLGSEILRRKLRHLRMTMTDDTVSSMMKFFKVNSSQDLFYKVELGLIGNADIKNYVEKKSSNFYHIFNRIRKRTVRSISTKPNSPDKVYDQLVFGDEEDQLDYQLATCCSPIAGDHVFGFLTVEKGIKVHKSDCPNATSLHANYAYRLMKAKWINKQEKEEFSALLEVEGMDEMGLINKLTDLLSKKYININSLNFKGNDGIFKGEVSIIVKNKKQLQEIMDSIKKLAGIKRLHRKYK